MSRLLRMTPAGLSCPAGEFFIDPTRPVADAVVTHAHADHARRGHGRYFTTEDGQGVLQSRLGPGARVETIPYGESISLRGVQVSLHAAGHVLGSAQVRVEHQGETWVASGDYKTDPDPTCRPFELQRCDVFITEATFARPAFRWPSPEETFAELNAWRRVNRDAGRASVLFVYAFGKAQRVLAALDPSLGPIVCEGEIERLNASYRQAGVDLPQTVSAGEALRETSPATVLAPPRARAWARRFGDAATALVSGWMLFRGAAQRRGVDQGFVVSDHADSRGLRETVAATGASQVYVDHGDVDELVRLLRRDGVSAAPLSTPDAKPSSVQRTLF